MLTSLAEQGLLSIESVAALTAPQLKAALEFAVRSRGHHLHAARRRHAQAPRTAASTTQP